MRVERGKLKAARGDLRGGGDGIGAKLEGEFAELDGEFHIIIAKAARCAGRYSKGAWPDWIGHR